MFLHVVIAFIVISIIALQWHRRKYLKLYSEIKLKKREMPILGHALAFVGNGEDRMEALNWIAREAIEIGGLTAGWILHKLHVAIADPEDAELVLKTCLQKGHLMDLMKTIYDNASLVAPVDIWRLRRRVNAPTFSSRNLSQFVEIFSKQSSLLVKQLHSNVDKGPFSILRYINAYTFDSICDSTLGVHVGLQKDPSHPFFKAVEMSFDMIATRMVRPWLYSEKVYKMFHLKELTEVKKVMTGFVNQIIQSNRRSKDKTTIDEQKQKESKNGHYNERPGHLRTFLDLIKESSERNRKGYSDVELQEEALLLVVAATDTTTAGLAFTAVMLSQYPDVQEKVYQELKEVFGDSSRPVVNEDLARLNYLEAVIRETLRLYPPVPTIPREVKKDVTLPSGSTLLAGTTALVHLWAINRNPRYWGSDAEEFRPDRFIDLKFKHPAQFMTFSYGPRNCIGYRYAIMSMKTSMANLLRQYRLLPANSPDTTSNCNGSQQHRPLRLKWDVIMKDADNFQIKLESRK